ncbi:MAG: HAMP domain-containing histidine kinase [Acidobacteria bacterium]|nr:HAMP domain-containing histidine kinase [Acidobacteriota bacterium]
MDVLLLGLDPNVEGLLRKHTESSSTQKVHFHSSPAENGADFTTRQWDMIVLDRSIRSNVHLADAVKTNSLGGLKIVLTEKENLDSAIEFWGPAIYSYIFKPVNWMLFQVIWQQALERIRLNSKLFRLEKQHEKKHEMQQKKRRAHAPQQEEILKDLFVTHLKMQELDQEKTDFLARTSHELRTPLTALQGYLELLAHSKAGAVNELQAHLLGRSLDTCRRLQGLSNSLMDLSTLNSNRTHLQLGKENIQECLAQVVAELSQAIEEKNLELRFDNAAEIPKFRFDADQMHQVFINLLDNAIKFTPAGGGIQIRSLPYFWERRTVRELVFAQQDRRIAVSPADFNSVRISVEDTGRGIPPECLQDIFQEYSRVVNGNGSPKGFGLGLAVARKIVMAHEGKVWAENRQGQGSAFTVLIPISL